MIFARSGNITLKDSEFIVNGTFFEKDGGYQIIELSGYDKHITAVIDNCIFKNATANDYKWHCNGLACFSGVEAVITNSEFVNCYTGVSRNNTFTLNDANAFVANYNNKAGYVSKVDLDLSNTFSECTYNIIHHDWNTEIPEGVEVKVSTNFTDVKYYATEEQDEYGRDIIVQYYVQVTEETE